MGRWGEDAYGKVGKEEGVAAKGYPRKANDQNARSQV